MSAATTRAKKAAQENCNDPSVKAQLGQYNLNMALFQIAEAIEGLEERLDRLEKKK